LHIVHNKWIYIKMIAHLFFSRDITLGETNVITLSARCVVPRRSSSIYYYYYYTVGASHVQVLRSKTGRGTVSSLVNLRQFDMLGHWFPPYRDLQFFCKQNWKYPKGVICVFTSMVNNIMFSLSACEECLQR